VAAREARLGASYNLQSIHAPGGIDGIASGDECSP
jgi:hypothetical protein